jgi:hypothetical protein
VLKRREILMLVVFDREGANLLLCFSSCEIWLDTMPNRCPPSSTRAGSQPLDPSSVFTIAVCKQRRRRHPGANQRA